MNFDALETLRLYLIGLRDEQRTSLANYHDEGSNGFYHQYARPTPGKPSMASSATCVLSLTATDEWSTSGWCERSEALASTLLHEPWDSAGLDPNNVFTVGFALEAVRALIGQLSADRASAFEADPAHSARFAEGEGYLRQAVKDGYAKIAKYPESAYLTQLAVRVLDKRGKLETSDKTRVEECAWREIHKQFALITSQSRSADLFQLAYSIILVTSLGRPGNFQPDQNLMLRSGIDLLFANQRRDGGWPRSQPLFHYPDVGNAYCYEYEMLTQLLSEDRLGEALLPHLEELGAAAYGLQRDSFLLAGGGHGWSSGHHPQIIGPESWSTASVFHFAHVLDRLVAEAIRRATFEYLRVPLTPFAHPRPNGPDFAPDFVDCPLRRGNEIVSLKQYLFAHFVGPLAKEAEKVSAGGKFSDLTAMSAIFFGPPGTSKTELARRIAKHLDWAIAAIDPSHFVRHGMDQIQAEADKIFGMLTAAERVVVLLDEFDEMVKDRHQVSEVLSRFLTTAMLPKLATINHSRKIVFIVATNYIDQFDLAISRPGRFDLIIQIMPPGLEGKLAFDKVERQKVNAPPSESLQERLGRLGIPLDATEQWAAKIEALTFDEFRAMARALDQCETTLAAAASIDEHFDRCTLSSAFDNENTWADVCKEQESKMRLGPSGR